MIKGDNWSYKRKERFKLIKEARDMKNNNEKEKKCILCGCGCGQVTKFRRNIPNKYINTHYIKINNPMSNEDLRKKLSNSLKLAMNRPEVKEKFLGSNNVSKRKDVRIKLKEHRAKQVFPLKDTSIEIKIQEYLKELKIEYVTHHYIKDIEHKYQCDIFIPSLNLVIECDGNYWHKYPDGNEIDHTRTQEMQEAGYKVLRLWETEINKMTVEYFKNMVMTNAN